jgi:hypothetical protein
MVAIRNAKLCLSQMVSPNPAGQEIFRASMSGPFRPLSGSAIGHGHNGVVVYRRIVQRRPPGTPILTHIERGRAACY